MDVKSTALPGVLLVQPRVFGDARGYLLETYRRERYADAGIDAEFVQDNLSRSRRGVLRGLHLQHPAAQAKLVTALVGEVFDVAVDVRRGSPTWGRWVGVALSEENHLQLYVPEGFAHGFCVTGEHAVVAYKASAAYAPEAELAVRWDDPDLGIEWPVADPELADRDATAPRLAEIDPARLPSYPG